MYDVVLAFPVFAWVHPGYRHLRRLSFPSSFLGICALMVWTSYDLSIFYSYLYVRNQIKWGYTLMCHERFERRNQKVVSVSLVLFVWNSNIWILKFISSKFCTELKIEFIPSETDSDKFCKGSPNCSTGLSSSFEYQSSGCFSRFQQAGLLQKFRRTRKRWVRSETRWSWRCSTRVYSVYETFWNCRTFSQKSIVFHPFEFPRKFKCILEF